MGNIKFALDTGPETTNNNSWFKYIRCAPSFEEQNLVACHLTGDQVSDMMVMLGQTQDCYVSARCNRGRERGKGLLLSK